MESSHLIRQDSVNLTISLIVLTISLSVGGYFYLQNVYNYWNKRGIKGPKPRFIIGNFLTVFSQNRAKYERDYVKQYGKVYGIFLGSRPRLVVADPDLLTQICIKDFDSFTDHEVNEFSNKYQKSFLFTLKGDHWKKVRALTSPTFTSGKIKRMFRFLDACANDLIDCVEEHIESSDNNDEKSAIVNVCDIYNLYAMDAITTCCYGIKLERKGSSNLKSAATRDDFVKAALNFSSFNKLRIVVAMISPKPILRLIGFNVKPESDLMPLVKRASAIMDSRRKSGKNFDDYLQLLLDADLDSKLELDDLDGHEDHHAGLNRKIVLEDQEKMVNEVESNFRKTTTMDNYDNNNGGNLMKRKVVLSDLEIISGSIFLLSVGLDTTGTLLSNTSYLLAFHQEVQTKLYTELLKIVQKNKNENGNNKNYSFDYDSLTSCKYLDAVLSESLRLLTPVLTLDRVANQDYYLSKYDLHLPKGSIVNLAFHAIMNDEEYWPEPTKFNPERFMPGEREKIKPGTYCPFGLGPRHCIGMRFSLTEAKLALAKLLMNYNIQPAPNTSYPPELKIKFVLSNLKDPFVKFVQRK